MPIGTKVHKQIQDLDTFYWVNLCWSAESICRGVSWQTKEQFLISSEHCTTQL